LGRKRAIEARARAAREVLYARYEKVRAVSTVPKQRVPVEFGAPFEMLAIVIDPSVSTIGVYGTSCTTTLTIRGCPRRQMQIRW
jgi:hypothetical protein